MTSTPPSRIANPAPSTAPSPITLVPTPPAPQRRLNLAKLDDVARELGYLYRQVDRGLLPSQEATRRAYLLQVLTKTLEVTTLEQRLDRLEKTHGA
jgi:hypothetical protein